MEQFHSVSTRGPPLPEGDLLNELDSFLKRINGTSCRRSLPLGEERARAGGVCAHADPCTARRQGPRAQLAARRPPGERRVPLLCTILGREQDLQGAGHRDQARGDPAGEVDQRARQLESRGWGARPHDAELEEGVGKL